LTATVDHLVYACPDLDAAVTEIERATGVRAAAGGHHLGLGTHNALLALGERTYLEIIAPDPAQHETVPPRPFGLDDLAVPALRGWAAAPADLEAAVLDARAAGYDYGDIVGRRRRTMDGGELSWRMTTASASPATGVLPFLIDWQDSAHPAPGAPAGLLLEEFRLFAPDPEFMAARLRALGLDLPVERAAKPALRAVLTGAAGRRIVLDS
jgi:hypothetical protein